MISNQAKAALKIAADTRTNLETLDRYLRMLGKFELAERLKDATFQINRVEEFVRIQEGLHAPSHTSH